MGLEFLEGTKLVVHEYQNFPFKYFVYSLFDGSYFRSAYSLSYWTGRF